MEIHMVLFNYSYLYTWEIQNSLLFKFLFNFYLKKCIIFKLFSNCTLLGHPVYSEYVLKSIDDDMQPSQIVHFNFLLPKFATQNIFSSCTCLLSPPLFETKETFN